MKSIPQLPGCLPKGYSLDSMLTPEQFQIWQNQSRHWWSARRNSLPGVIQESRKHIRIHPRTYLESKVKK